MSVRVGFIGTGGVAGGHMERFNENPDAQLAAYCDVELSRAQQAANQYGGQAYQDFRAMLDSEDLDAVAICVPPFAHGDIELEACRRGLPMFIEKPVALDMDMARPIGEAIQEAGLLTLVAYKYRWDDHVIKARDMLADKNIGLVFGNYWGAMPEVSWWRVMSKSGGQMVEQATHIVDMARYFCGEITEVQAFGTQQAMAEVYTDFDIQDAITANLQFTSGAVGTISCTCMVDTWGQSSLRVLAHGFTLSIAGDSLTWADSDGPGEYTKRVDGYTNEDDAFIQAIQTGDSSQIHSDYADALRTLAVTVAVNESVQRDGQVISVAELL